MGNPFVGKFDAYSVCIYICVCVPFITDRHYMTLYIIIVDMFWLGKSYPVGTFSGKPNNKAPIINQIIEFYNVGSLFCWDIWGIYKIYYMEIYNSWYYSVGSFIIYNKQTPIIEKHANIIGHYTWPNNKPPIGHGLDHI